MQPLTIFQRSLTTMQIQIQGLLQFAVPLFPTAEVSHTPRRWSLTLLSSHDDAAPTLSPSRPPQRDLLGIQHLLNSSEASLHQLTALLDCRGLNKVGSDEDKALTHLNCCVQKTACFFVVCFFCLFSVMLSVMFADFLPLNGGKLKSKQQQNISILNLFINAHRLPECTQMDFFCCFTRYYCCFWGFSSFSFAQVW